MLSTVPAFSFAEPGLVNQFMEFQTGFTPTDLDWIQSFFEPVVPSVSSGESDSGSVRINTGLVNSGSDESSAGSIKSNSGSDLFSLPISYSDESKTISVKINSGFQNIKSGSDESCTGSHDSSCFHGVPSPQSVELDSNNTKFMKTATKSTKDDNRKELNRPVSKVIDERKRKRMESNRESAKRSRMRKQKHIENLTEEVNRLGLENREIGNRLRIVLYQIEEVSRMNNRLLSEQEILRRRLSEMSQILILRQIQNKQQWSNRN